MSESTSSGFILDLISYSKISSKTKTLKLGTEDLVQLVVLEEFENEGYVDIGETMFKFVVQQAVKNLFGEIGECFVDVIKYDPILLEAILATSERFRVQLHGALTLFSCYENKRCAFRIHQISPSLMGLASDSQQMSLPIHQSV